MDGISSLNNFLTIHQPQLELSGVPPHFWPILWRKLNDGIFDAGETFSLLLVDYEDCDKQTYDPTWIVQVLEDRAVLKNDPQHIYLVDHTWTFRTDQARTHLREVPGLMQRICGLIGIDRDVERGEGELEDLVFDNIWKYAQTYALNTRDISAEDRVPIWYIMDELGSAIEHSDQPNFRIVPFIHMPEMLTYSLLFPIKDVEEGGRVFRNYIEGDYDEKYRDALLIPWKEYDHYDEDFTQTEPSSDYFSSGHVPESLPTDDNTVEPRDPSTKIKVFSQYNRINENLTRPEFEIVTEEGPAEVLWFINHFKAYKELSELAPHKYVNQFPHENVLTIKDLLCIVARRNAKGQTDKKTLQTYPAWLPTTFNLKTELVKFVAYYHQRELKGLDNLWISKPFNLARSLDTHITRNLHFITRLPLTGPKIIQKYIENPVLFERPDGKGKVKFDVRYVILLKSVKPLNVYLYRNFFLRFANKPFALNNFDEYEQHFTVMNYSNPDQLCRLLCADYMVEWNKQYPDHQWAGVEENIFKMIRELFECAVEKPAPCGIAPNRQSRALYATDIMLAWEKNAKGEDIIQPKLLEVNWMPDCDRACQYYPNFYNDIFSLFFLDETPDTCIQLPPH